MSAQSPLRALMRLEAGEPESLSPDDLLSFAERRIAALEAREGDPAVVGEDLDRNYELLTLWRLAYFAALGLEALLMCRGATR